LDLTSLIFAANWDELITLLNKTSFPTNTPEI
jgi:hypothetical protein